MPPTPRPPPTWAFALAGALGVLVLAGLGGVAFKALRAARARAAAPPPPALPLGSTSASASAFAPPVVVPSASDAPRASSTAAVPAAPVACAPAGRSLVVAPRVVASVGLDVRSVGDAVGIGFAATPTEAVAVTLDPATLAVVSSRRAPSTRPLRHVQPGVDAAALPVADVDDPGDALAGHRSLVAGSSRVDFGVSGGAIAGSSGAQAAPRALFPLASSSPVEALRIATNGKGAWALAGRQGTTVLLGALEGDPPAARGALELLDTHAAQVGTPAVAALDGATLVAWAEKTDAWHVRVAADRLAAATTFEPPAGGLGEQVLAPSLAALPVGGALLTWTEGAAKHQVRGLVLDAAGRPSGKPLDLSADGVDAGQAQAAVLPDGRGIAAFLVVDAAKSYKLVATPITCAAR